MRPGARRSNGRHETGAQTVPDATEEPMTAPAPQTAPDDVLDDWLDAYDRAQQRAELAQGSATSMEDTIRDGQQRADAIRTQAQQKRQEAAEKDATATALLAELDKIGEQLKTARGNLARHTRTAQHHGGNINAEIAKGAEDPRVRRERLANDAKDRGVSQPHPVASQTGPQAPPLSVLDGPNPPLSPSVTHPFPAHDDLDQAQPVPAADGGSS